MKNGGGDRPREARQPIELGAKSYRRCLKDEEVTLPQAGKVFCF
jgi:hypothetical protein